FVLCLFVVFFFFFFQAEDGIRDRNVTGVQTCALPILPAHHRPKRRQSSQRVCGFFLSETDVLFRYLHQKHLYLLCFYCTMLFRRSEERRVGKECRCGWVWCYEKKKEDSGV